MKTVVRKDLWVRVPRPPQTGSNHGVRYHRIDVLGVLFDALDGFETVVQVPDWPCLVDVIRRLIRTFAESLSTDRGCNGLLSIKPFPGPVLHQAQSSVDVQVRDPDRSGSPEVVNGCQRRVVLGTSRTGTSRPLKARLASLAMEDLDLLSDACLVSAVVPVSIDAYDSMVVLTGRGVVIGSAWRCETFQVSPSRRKTMVTRSAIGLISELFPNRACVRSI